MEYSSYSSENIGRNIKKLRRQRKITQKEFARQLEKAERTIQKYESGEINIPHDVLQQMGEVLDIPWFQLLTPEARVILVKPDDSWRSKYSFESLGDVVNALFQIMETDDFSADITVKKPPEDAEWTADIGVNGKGNRKYDTDFCLFLENWRDKLSQLQSGHLSRELYNEWQDKTVAYYEDSKLSVTEDEK